jgi:hypothetical protein
LETKLSKIYTSSSGTEQNPTLANNLTKIGSTRSREEHQPHAGGGPLSRDSQHTGFGQPVNKKLQDSCLKWKVQPPGVERERPITR